MKQRSLIFAVLTVIWCVMIFSLSCENADDSTQTSGRVVTVICETFVPDYKEMTVTQQDDLKESMSFAVRKCAHFSAYALLGALAFGAFGFISRRKIRALCSVGFAFLYACSDELHQYFVPGRSCEFRDVLIDTGGAVLSVLILLLILHIADKRKRQRAD